MFTGMNRIIQTYISVTQRVTVSMCYLLNKLKDTGNINF